MPGLPNSYLARLLASAALMPGLRSILVLDPSPAFLDDIASTLEEMLAVVTGQGVDRVYVGAASDEEELWGHAVPQAGDQGLEVVWQPGSLTQPVENRARLVLIPDLPRLSLTAMRGAVALMGAPAGHLEREGRSRGWAPELCWVAACPSTEVGTVPPHLRDRFALRLIGGTVPARLRAQDIFRSVNRRCPPAIPRRPRLPSKLVTTLRRAARHWPLSSSEWQEWLYQYLPVGDGCRRQLALVRLALAEARLENAREVTPEHVQNAAQLLGLRPEAGRGAATAGPAVSAPEPERESGAHPARPVRTQTPLDEPLRSGFHDESSSRTMDRAYETPEDIILPAAPVPMDVYAMEDAAPLGGEPEALRLPVGRGRPSARARGAAVGTEPATSMTDLALVSTLIRAAPFQPSRRRNHLASPGRWLLTPGDLRAHRREHPPEQLLVLVLDHTCLAGSDWQAAVRLHLHWAYVERASICVIGVGVAGERDLQAERLFVHSLLAPQLGPALVPRPGGATPLAHGLVLALKAIRHGMQHGRGAAREARLVLVTDGRGNVPLEASETGSFSSPVGRTGIEDALRIAHVLGGTKRLSSYVLDTGPKEYPELPAVFSEALGGIRLVITPAEDSEALVDS